jgi:hypothetical protein
MIIEHLDEIYEGPNRFGSDINKQDDEDSDESDSTANLSQENDDEDTKNECSESKLSLYIKEKK